MNQNSTPIRFKLNLFDGIVLALALCVGAVLVYLYLGSAQEVDPVSSPDVVSLTYTVQLMGAVEGTAAVIQEGDLLEEASKNLSLGTVVSVTSAPSTRVILDETTMTLVEVDVPGKEDIDIVINSPATFTEDQILLTSGHRIRVNEWIYVRGPGYLGSGTTIDIVREESK